ncbi:MAG: membrane protein insertion efficiency factor YidD [Zetaproteobacteria bacterium]|nr:membrane protein insertion efficiency factor YidD [Zetaproteobacteria bacterium]
MKLLMNAYIILALCSGIMALTWQSMRFPSSTPQTFPIRFYQQVLGSWDGRSCPSYPVCSVYARQAFQTHGALVGSWLMLDRLIHEADDVHRHHTIAFEGETRLDDTLQRNDFWLNKE